MDAVKVLLVTFYFPPAGGAGVPRLLKLAEHLPELGIETHVLAPDDPKWLHVDESLEPPPAAIVHRAKNLGPRSRRPAEELARRARRRPARRAGAAPLPRAARSGRERRLGDDRGDRRGPAGAQGGDRRRRHHVASRLGAPRRLLRAPVHAGALGGRPPRLDRVAPPPAPPDPRRGRARAARRPPGGRGRRAPRTPSPQRCRRSGRRGASR